MATAAQGMSRTVVVASEDTVTRQRLQRSLSGMRWNVVEAQGGAEALMHVEGLRPDAVLLDHWFHDLDAAELAGELVAVHPGLDLMHIDGQAHAKARRSAGRHELLVALRELMDAESTAPATDTAAWNAVPVAKFAAMKTAPKNAVATLGAELLPEMTGDSEPMRRLAQLIRLVAPRTATVLIEGETGTGKELVARAVHQLSERANRPFAVLNCAAIPEALLEAELFGHTRGAFTGAVSSRTGRIEAANGGTLFLDEIGEMPLALQAKMLRFLECGELQRVGDNEVVRVDVRVVAATHQDLKRRSADGSFRLDLYHRLAVFPVRVPALRERTADIPELTERTLARLARELPRKQMHPAAMEMLLGHRWPGNVRELEHVIERATILAGESATLGTDEIVFYAA